MGFKKRYHLPIDYKVSKKIPWYYAPFFAAFWLILYIAVVVTQIDHLPRPLTVEDEVNQPEAFIAERASEIHLALANIGPKVVGSVANEIIAVDFLKAQVEKIRAVKSDNFNIDIDVQEASGSYVHWTMINMYQAIQNVVVRLSPKESASDNYLLINSHFDSVPGSPGAGDDGSMVSVMLEVMRVIAKSKRTLKHPIVFLFNGAEENPLQASHAFITQHKWAKNCKALINLDAAGSGGREILFQSGPKNSWLMRYYRQVPHPFANTMGEEVFQAGLIPSDTDFRIFRDFGHVPGLDMAYVFNGYVYHTKYDRVSVFPKASLQNTGDNVLSLAWALGNAPELDDNSKYEDAHVIFYDFIGWFMIFYTEKIGIIINVVVCFIAFAAFGTSLYFMSRRSGLGFLEIFKRSAIIFSLQLLSLVLGAGLVELIAIFMDGIGYSLSWFSENWILIGLYFCPMFFGMGIIPACYLEWTKTDQLSLGFRIQLFMHSHCLFLILLTLATTALGIRSAFMPMVAVLFEILALIINLITKFHRRDYYFAIVTVICQILPFLFYTSIAQTFYSAIIPMTGRSGPDSMPDLQISSIAVLMSLLFAGFIIPLFLFFRKTRTIFCCFIIITLIFIILAVSPIGFPFKQGTATQRYAMLHARRILHDSDNNVRVDEAGVYIFPQDRRIASADTFIESLGSKRSISEYCYDEMFCGMPIYNHRWQKQRESSYWIPIDEIPHIPGEYPQIQTKSIQVDGNRKHFVFSLSGPDHMTIFIGVVNQTKIIDWSFNRKMIEENWEPPYFILFSYGKNSSALEFSIDVEQIDSSTGSSSLEIGVVGHWIHQELNRTAKYSKFVESFPDYAYIDDKFDVKYVGYNYPIGKIIQLNNSYFKAGISNFYTSKTTELVLPDREIIRILREFTDCL